MVRLRFVATLFSSDNRLILKWDEEILISDYREMERFVDDHMFAPPVANGTNLSTNTYRSG